MAGNHKPQMRKRAVTLVTLLLFIALTFGVRWVVKTQRSPGAITVIEAQGMDMTAMKAPQGTQPVAAEKAQYRRVGSEQSFPATVMAFSDEEIIARVPGRVLSLAYPGDHVRAGQIVAQLDAREYFDQQRQARFMAESSGAQTQASRQEVDLLRASKARTLADLNVANVGVSKSEADKEVAAQELQRTLSEADAKKARVKDREADLIYAEQDLGRQQQLYGEGFTSLDQFQRAQRAHDTAESKVQEAEAEAAAMDKAAQAASGRVSAMDKEIEQSKAQVKSAQAAILEADKDVEKAKAEVRSSKDQAQASLSQADSASQIAGYTQMRSVDSSMVSERYVAPGSIVAVGQKLLMLHMAEKVRIQAQLPEALAAFVSPGTPVVIRYGELVRPSRITSAFPTADTSTRTFTVEAILDNPAHRFLPGSFATMSVQTAETQSQLAVRSPAIQTDASGTSFVWVVAESAEGQKTDWTCPMHTEVSETGPGNCPICKMELVPRSRGGRTIATRRAVTAGASDGPFTAVTGDLKPDEAVIWAGFETLIQGSPIQVVSWGENGPKQLEPVEPHSKTRQAAASHKQLYTCPMHPEVILDHPGRCPKCGMELIPKKAPR